MAGLKEIRRRLKSVNNTKKITYAMKLVSAAKLRKTQEAVVRSRSYAETLIRVLGDILRREGTGDNEHPLMEVRTPIKAIRLIVLGGSRGLCGAYNTNINRRIEAFYREKLAERPGIAITTSIIGRKPAEYFRRQARVYNDALEVLPDDPQRWPLDELSQRVESGFKRGEFDEVYILYMKFKSAISMTPIVEKVLPLDPLSPLFAAERAKEVPSVITKYEPSPEAVFTAVIPRLVRSMVRQAALDTRASEHASRMTAMDAATKNASELISTLTLRRNKLRQSGITNQLLDIVGGAEAIQ